MACTLMNEVVPISKDGRSPENDRVNNRLGLGLFMATMPSCRVHSNSTEGESNEGAGIFLENISTSL